MNELEAKKRPPNSGSFSASNQPAKRGRKPTGEFNAMDIAVRVGDMKVKLLVNGRPKYVTSEEAYVIGLVYRGLKGDVQSMIDLLHLRSDAPLIALRRKMIIYLSKEELAV